MDITRKVLDGRYNHHLKKIKQKQTLKTIGWAFYWFSVGALGVVAGKLLVYFL